MAWEGKLVLLYSGNMGNKQGLECLAPIAIALAPLAHVHCVFCGDGAFRPELETMVAGLPNVSLLPLQPVERLNELLNLAAIHLLPQRADVADLVMPSRLNGMLASGRPVIAMAAPGTQVAAILGGTLDLGIETHAPCGLVVAPERPEEVVAAVRTLIEDRELRDRLGAGARAYAVRHLGQQQVLELLEEQLGQLVKQRRSTF